jgi:hypothetical protein
VQVLVADERLRIVQFLQFARDQPLWGEPLAAVCRDWLRQVTSPLTKDLVDDYALSMAYRFLLDLDSEPELPAVLGVRVSPSNLSGVLFSLADLRAATKFAPHLARAVMPQIVSSAELARLVCKNTAEVKIDDELVAFLSENHYTTLAEILRVARSSPPRAKLRALWRVLLAEGSDERPDLRDFVPDDAEKFYADVCAVCVDVKVQAPKWLLDCLDDVNSDFDWSAFAANLESLLYDSPYAALVSVPLV